MSDPVPPPRATPAPGTPGVPDGGPAGKLPGSAGDAAKPADAARTKPVAPAPPVRSGGGGPSGGGGGPAAGAGPRPGGGQPASARPAALPAAGRRAAPTLTAIALMLLLLGLGTVWYQQNQLEQQVAWRADMDAMREQMRGLQQRLGQIEQRPEADPRALEQRIGVLEQRPAAGPAADLRPLEARIAALEQRPAVAEADPALAGRLAALDQRLAEAVRQAERQAASGVRLARLRRAAVALEAGQRLGEIAGAPAALARYATAAPPTETALRRSFAEAAARAGAASRPEVDQGIAARLWGRLRGLVTVRAGDEVVLGSPAATVLSHAAKRLAEGDLAGAIAALDALDPGAAAAMAEWRGQAAGLIAARAALAGMMAD